jgi:hypothetical protein
MLSRFAVDVDILCHGIAGKEEDEEDDDEDDEEDDDEEDDDDETFSARGGKTKDVRRMVNAAHHSEEKRRAAVLEFKNHINKTWAMIDNVSNKIKDYIDRNLIDLDKLIHSPNADLSCRNCPAHCLPKSVRKRRMARNNGKNKRELLVEPEMK